MIYEHDEHVKHFLHDEQKKSRPVEGDIDLAGTSWLDDLPVMNDSCSSNLLERVQSRIKHFSNLVEG